MSASERVCCSLIRPQKPEKPSTGTQHSNGIRAPQVPFYGIFYTRYLAMTDVQGLEIFQRKLFSFPAFFSQNLAATSQRFPHVAGTGRGSYRQGLWLSETFGGSRRELATALRHLRHWQVCSILQLKRNKSHGYIRNSLCRRRYFGCHTTLTGAVAWQRPLRRLWTRRNLLLFVNNLVLRTSIHKQNSDKTIFSLFSLEHSRARDEKRKRQNNINAKTEEKAVSFPFFLFSRHFVSRARLSRRHFVSLKRASPPPLCLSRAGYPTAIFSLGILLSRSTIRGTTCTQDEREQNRPPRHEWKLLDKVRASNEALKVNQRRRELTVNIAEVSQCPCSPVVYLCGITAWYQP